MVFFALVLNVIKIEGLSEVVSAPWARNMLISLGEVAKPLLVAAHGGQEEYANRVSFQLLTWSRFLVL